MNKIQKTGFGILFGIIIVCISVLVMYHIFGIDIFPIPLWLDIVIRGILLLLIVVSIGLCHYKTEK